LTSAALASFRVRIPPEALPKTFKDAIRVTRYLGLDHLWIDSLCIIQDSAENWRAESGMMTETRPRSWKCQTRSKHGPGSCLSRRTLHFTEGQVFWECDEGPACEL
ncbi:hypothetical protein B0H67DRAFT_447179, partial [Lasiosphaeris hirsuta]